MIGLMLYVIVVSAIVAGAARAAESLARLLGYRLRLIWAGAFAFAALLSIKSAIQRFDTRDAAITIAATNTHGAITAPANATFLRAIESVASQVGRAIGTSLALASTAIDRALSPEAASWFALLWSCTSIVLATMFAVVIHRFHRARRAWPRSRVDDVAVRVSPSVGPVVVGVVRPEIVVPRWLLRRSPDEQRLVVAHELEHLRARDPLLLSAGWLMVILLPWNPAVWYMLTRLRLAIELDCDARVLRRGATPRAYGSLLIDVAQHASSLTLSALGLAGASSQLYQRILALRGPVGSFARMRIAIAATITAAALAVACTVAPPSKSVVAAGPTPDVVSVPVTSVAPAQASPTPAPTRAAPVAEHVTRPAAIVGAKDSTAATTVRRDSITLRAEPVIFINGVRSSAADLRRLDPKTIDHVEVVKGPAAVAEYGDDALSGVITITTKPAAPPA